MVWAKLTDDFPDRAARAELSDAAFRTHVEALCWVMRRETGGALTARDLRRCAETTDPPAAAAELVAAGWWRPAAAGWLLVESMGDQPDPETIEARRRMASERQRRKRRKAAQLDPTPADPEPVSRRDSPRDAMRDDPRDPGRDGTGRDGTTRSTDGEVVPVNGWPAVPPVPGARVPVTSRGRCVADGCTDPPRRSCRTCAAHMDREPVGAGRSLG